MLLAAALALPEAVPADQEAVQAAFRIAAAEAAEVPRQTPWEAEVVEHQSSAVKGSEAEAVQADPSQAALAAEAVSNLEAEAVQAVHHPWAEAAEHYELAALGQHRPSMWNVLRAEAVEVAHLRLEAVEGPEADQHPLEVVAGSLVHVLVQVLAATARLVGAFRPWAEMPLEVLV